MLDVQIKGMKWRLTWLQDDYTGMGIWLDIGSISEGIVFNCEIEMPSQKNPWKSPWIVPCIKSLEDIDKLEVPDPYRHEGIKAYYEKLEKYDDFDDCGRCEEDFDDVDFDKLEREIDDLRY